ncbi:motility associated factor glycosyltransferase family protein [Saccharibacillus deserti]|uniref:motility associated factor glycosyltransferase family protein n=1 Tax=Saccharibacillus deserti TaxID=1634444 RepID=UPI001C13240C|nr:6-hydroxymethylpterin diphosphokinase MptE-like protein [Saccharibacillus deserti]
MNNFERNLAVLKNKFPHVWNELKDISEAASDNSNAYVEPIEQDIPWLEAVKQSVEDTECIFVYGFGQGLGLMDLIEQYTSRLFMVYEPDIDQFYRAILAYDLTPLFDHPNFYYLAVGKEQLNSLFYMASLHMHNELAFVALRHYLESEMDVLREVREKFQKYNHTYESNQNTHALFQQDWVRNSMYQMADMLRSPSIESLQGIYEGLTAVVVASGPSLQQDIDWIERMKPHAFIVAAGSSIQALVKHGIKPHLAVTLDGGVINNKVFEAPETLEAPLLYASTSYYGITDRKPEGKIHAVMSNDTITQYYMGLNHSDVAMTPTPTVVGTAIQAAVWMGATRIVLMGQDLSFPGNKFYAEGVNHVGEIHNRNLVDNAEVEIPNVNGGMNKTNVNFMFMKDALEKMFGSLPDIEFINTTRNGASLAGTTWEPIENVWERVAGQTFNADLLPQSASEVASNGTLERIEFTKNKLKSTLNDFVQVENEVKALLKVINPLREISRTKPAKCQNTIVEIEERWTRIVNREWFTQIYESVLPREMAAFDQKQPLIVLEQNLMKKADLLYDVLGALLKEIKNKFPFLDEIFKESIARIERSEAKEEQF